MTENTATVRPVLLRDDESFAQIPFTSGEAERVLTDAGTVGAALNLWQKP